MGCCTKITWGLTGLSATGTGCANQGWRWHWKPGLPLQQESDDITGKAIAGHRPVTKGERAAREGRKDRWEAVQFQ